MGKLQGRLTVEQLAFKIGRSTQTVRSWILWAETEGKNHPTLKLPKAEFNGQANGRTYSVNDIDAFVAFSKNINYGDMGAWNASRSWGKRGVKINKRRALKAQGVKVKNKKRKPLKK